MIQVTTSSQRDQDDENILIVDSESDEEMPDDGPVEPDDAIQFEDEGDNVEPFEEAQGIYHSYFYFRSFGNTNIHIEHNNWLIKVNHLICMRR